MEVMQVKTDPSRALDVFLHNFSGNVLRITGVDDIDRLNGFPRDPIAITSEFLWLSGKKPYFVNIAYIECVVGEWNKDRTQYGVRIFLRSGNSVWTADGVKVLKKLYGDKAAEFFKEVAAKGDD